ncbi:MAG TPA: Cys-tRNA(Pro) deacylase [Capsulimonadaceae bacterium]|jgi:Cys-tRNA(Pro)/Cys-tRNA(Cys) deacylase
MKTNAVRIVEEAGIAHRLAAYDVGESDLSAETVAKKVGLPNEQVLKTLVVRGDKTGILMAMIAAGTELDLKAVAAASSNKHCELLALKDVLPTTGYIRGGVSPLGAKKRFPVLVDETAQLFDEVAFSAGQRGLQLIMAPDDLMSLTAATYADIQR